MLCHEPMRLQLSPASFFPLLRSGIGVSRDCVRLERLLCFAGRRVDWGCLPERRSFDGFGICCRQVDAIGRVVRRVLRGLRLLTPLVVLAEG